MRVSKCIYTTNKQSGNLSNVGLESNFKQFQYLPSRLAWVVGPIPTLQFLTRHQYHVKWAWISSQKLIQRMWVPKHIHQRTWAMWDFNTTSIKAKHNYFKIAMWFLKTCCWVSLIVVWFLNHVCTVGCFCYSFNSIFLECELNQSWCMLLEIHLVHFISCFALWFSWHCWIILNSEYEIQHKWIALVNFCMCSST